jgi:pimeloyl-ACP methyl ester carboxylesterase
VAAAWNAYLPTLYAGTKPVDFAEYRKSLVASLKRPGYASAFSLTTRLTHAPAEASLSRVSAPVLVVMGENDPDFKNPRGEAEWIAETLHGTAVLVPEAGHYPQSQQPAVVASAVLAFLADVTARA